MFVDPEEAQVRVSMIVRVNQNNIWSLGRSRGHDATCSGKKYHFEFHNYGLLVCFFLVSTIHLDFLNQPLGKTKLGVRVGLRSSGAHAS